MPGETWGSLEQGGYGSGASNELTNAPLYDRGRASHGRGVVQSLTAMNYRSDIQGLRAIAVIAVMAFHYNPAWLPGGFIGVDVFLVDFHNTSSHYRGE